MLTRYLLPYAAAAVAARETLLTLRRHKQQGRVYAEALQRARSLGRPLLVFGRPDAGIRSWLLGAPHPPGDVCVPADCAGIKHLEELPSDSYVVVTSYTIEYTRNPLWVMIELSRLCGYNRANVFCATMLPTSLATYVSWRPPTVFRNNPFAILSDC